MAMMSPVPCGVPARDLPPAEFALRAKRFLNGTRRLRLDAALVVGEVSRYYLTGVRSSNGALLFSPDPVFYTDFRYLAAARQRVSAMPVKAIWRSPDEAEWFGRVGKNWRRVGYEGQMEATRFNRLRTALPQVEWVDIAPMLGALRAVKSAAEQRVMRQAVAANDRLFAELMRGIAPGISEWAIRGRVRALADTLGEGESFDTIACVGRNGAECHHTPGDTVLERGRSLLVDLGLRKNQYCADMTRTLFFGTPTPLFREVYGIVLEAQRKAIQAIRPGRRCDAIDTVARRIIEKAGYGRAFGHGLGHSLGLEIHESPSFSPFCQTELKTGMILTVEPGIYLPGRFGVRIEDVVLVTKTGCEVLSQTPRNLI